LNATIRATISQVNSKVESYVELNFMLSIKAQNVLKTIFQENSLKLQSIAKHVKRKPKELIKVSGLLHPPHPI
jgi:predicted transcriptional regulator